MGVHLVGGGTGASAFAPFAADVVARAAMRGSAPAEVAVVTVRGAASDAHASELAGLLASASSTEVAVRVVAVDETDVVDPQVFASADGIVVGGGLTPAYHRALAGAFGVLRAAVADGTPYLGFSAGAMIAADRAIIGGWRIGGVAVVPEETAEDLDEITVVEGIGLVDVAIDVHVAQWGTLGRLVAATEAGLIDGGIGIDESTVLVADADGLRIAGEGSVWRVQPGPDGAGVLVFSDRAGA